MSQSYASSSNTVQRVKLTSELSVYVRTDGSNNNNGLSDTAGGAFATIQRAVDVVTTSYDAGGYDVNICVAPGAYTGDIDLKTGVGHGLFTIRGTDNVPADVVLTTALTSGQYCSTAWVLQDLSLSNPTGNCIFVNSSRLNLNRVDFGVCSGNHMVAYYGGQIYILGDYTITDDASVHYFAAHNSVILASDIHVTLTGTPAFVDFVRVNLGAVCRATAFTFTGAATGSRYDVSVNGVIQTTGAGATYFPGNAAGTAATGGLYV